APLLDALVQARFVTVRVLDGQPVYRFAREADRRAWGDAIVTARKTQVRSDVAKALAASGEVVQAAVLLPDATELQVRAGDELSARGAHEDAAEHYARALLSLTGVERAKVLDRSAQVQAVQGELRRAARSLLESNRLSASSAKV